MSQPIVFRLPTEYLIKPFDCGDNDLNDFLFNDAQAFQAQRLAVTYLLEDEQSTVAFFSILNDKVSVDDFQGDNTSRNRFNRRLPNAKRFRSYPAVKLARLGVSNQHKGGGYGTLILDFLKRMLMDSSTACRFLTVDAYQQALHFYERNGFAYLTTRDEGQATRLMYFDLSTLL